MYRVVLIDDERLIVEGLRRGVKWGDYNCEVVATAEDSVSGAKTIREHEPHILFTDIKMPGDDGLAMLAGLRSEFPDMQVAVLTGHRDFAFAQESIRLGVVRFLLKPSKMDAIDEALTEMTSRLGKMQQSEDKEPSAAQAGSFIVRQAIAYMKENYARKLSLQEVADQCYVSQWHLSKLLNRHADQSFYDILNKLRIDAAKEMLANPRLKIGEISDMVGYADTAHFARTFKKLEGMSANEYRNSLA